MQIIPLCSLINPDRYMYRTQKSSTRFVKVARAPLRKFRRAVRRPSIARGMLTANTQVHKISHAQVFKANYNQATGLQFAGGPGGFNPVFGVSPLGALLSDSNSAWDTEDWTNGQPCAYIFQQCRITQWSVEVHYSTNSNSVDSLDPASNHSPSTPIVYSVVDREDAVGLVSTNGAVQYSSFKVYDCLRNSKHVTVDNSPTVSADALTTSTFIGTSASALRKVSPWISLGSNTSTEGIPSIPHGFIKMYVDPGIGNSSTSVNGVFTFIVRAIMEYRGID